ncbi:MAG: ABC transporter ATP-binding protein, partial [Acidobacteria bacterium]|nr:ABC transporter ATP-binding protein [Acidobacteriota bacterium]
RLILDLVRPTSGTATVLGIPSTKLRGKPFEQIGYVSEEQQLPKWMKVGAFLRWCAPLYPTWDGELCDDLVRRFELPLDKKLKHLSRGMQMKARLVSSLAFRPRLLVLDEPFSGLDAVVRDDLLSGVLDLVAEDGGTILFTSHELSETESLADRVGFLREGKLLLSEETEDLRQRFRRVEVLRTEPGPLPEPWPESWLLPESAGATVRFVDCRHDTDSAERLAALFPDRRDLVVEALPLREIVKTLIRTRDAEGASSETES